MIFRQRRKDDADSKRALSEAEKHLSEVKGRAEEVREVAKETREIRIRNHFAEQLTEAIVFSRRKKPT
jgi:hypothetical protein